MDFRPTPAEARFRAALSDWLAAHRPAPRPPGDMADAVAAARAWQRTLHAGGWAGIAWPRDYGGRGATLVEQLIFAEEYARHRAPSPAPLGIGVPLVGPTLIHHGTPAQKRRFLPPILAGEELWCQGFSEPNAGSDLASLRTRGELRGDEIVVSGQKIWTSYARFAQWCILLLRTTPDAPRHRGLSFLLVDMQSPGITVRPLVEMTGHAWFNEVFFDEVRVPRANLVGPLDGGWAIAMGTLGHERGATAPYARSREELRDVVALARSRSPDGRVADPRLRQRLARHWIDLEVVRLTAYRTVSDTQRRGSPGPQSSILKLVWSEADQRTKDTVSAVQGAHGQLVAGSPHVLDAGRWTHEVLWARAATLYSGTSEVQRTVIAQRVLGLPRG